MSSQICCKRLVFDVAYSVGVVVAAGDDVAVFGYAHEFAKEASAQEEVVVPVVVVWHAPLLSYSRIEGYVDVDGWFAVIFGG